MNKTIGERNVEIREDVYEHLEAYRRDNEILSEAVERLVAEVEDDWRTHFGFLDDEAGEEFADVVSSSRGRLDADR